MGGQGMKKLMKHWVGMGIIALPYLLPIFSFLTNG
jgi:hypothetical protein